MKMVNPKYLSLLFYSALYFNFAFADFAQKHLRYMSYFDLISHMKRLNIQNKLCYKKTEDNSQAFGYSSPLSGKPMSSKPNYNFLLHYTICLQHADINFQMKQFLSPSLVEQIKLSAPYQQSDNSILLKVINQFSSQLIGPEAVLVSYGHFKNQAAFNDHILTSALSQFPNQTEIILSELIKKIFILIHLRDEFLSY